MPLFSVYFIIFLILTTALYYVIPKSRQWIVLLLASYVFYCLEGGLTGIVFVITTTITSFAAGILIEKNEGKKRKAVMISCLLLNFGILAVLKYGNFVIENVNALFANFGMGILPEKAFFILPLGISFYTFQTMGYVIDVYRGKSKANHDFWRFAIFISYFPQIIQGPISTYDDLMPQFEAEHEWDSLRFRRSVLRILWGFFKKIVIAERVGVIVNEVFNNYAAADYRGFIIFVAGLLYGIQVYADFSGGMDIIMGVSELLGISLKENFRQPYFALSVAEFWQRWHITLGAWMKQYVFYPICLSETAASFQEKYRKKLGPYYGKYIVPTIASFFAFLLVGIWHGAEWKYIVYGFYMAILVSSNTLCGKIYGSMRQFFKINAKSSGWKLFQMIRTTVLVLIGRFFSRGNSVYDAINMIKAMFSKFNIWIFFDDTLFTLGIDSKQMNTIILSIVLLFFVDYYNEKNRKTLREIISVKALPVRWIVYYAAIVIILVFGMYGPGFDASDFIYQRY